SYFNALLGCSTGVMLYRVGRSVFSRKVARRAFYCALFFPSLILWSSVAVKDAVMVFLLVVMMNSVMALKKRLSFLHVLLVTGSLLGRLAVRFYVFYMALLAIVVSLVLFSGRRVGAALKNQFLLIAALAIVIVVFGMRTEMESDLEMFDLQQAS